MSLDDLYREVILEHYAKPRHKGPLPEGNVHAGGANPVCGDEITLHLLVEGDVVRDARFEGHGCSISQASASMMTDLIIGRAIADAERLIEQFKGLMRGEEPAEELGDLAALAGVRKFPVRVKCATLPWVTLQQGFEEHRGARVAGLATTERER